MKPNLILQNIVKLSYHYLVWTVMLMALFVYSENKWKKRGISVTPVKHGMNFEPSVMYLNQAGALVHIYTDGSVLVSHAGIEMGQGLWTKMAQVGTCFCSIRIRHLHYYNDYGLTMYGCNS